MQFGAKIHGRDVVAAGALVLGPSDRDMSFDLDDMRYLVRLFPSATPTPFHVEFVSRDRKHLTIEVHGAFPEFTAAWKFSGIGEAGARRIDLDLMVFSQSNQPNCIRQVGFTFTATPEGDVEPPPLLIA